VKIGFGQGGCWFCQHDEEHEPLYSEREFDTFVHISCLKAALEKDPNHPEAELMKYLLEAE
jgi:hypothetical protein